MDHLLSGLNDLKSSSQILSKPHTHTKSYQVHNTQASRKPTTKTTDRLESIMAAEITEHVVNGNWKHCAETFLTVLCCILVLVASLWYNPLEFTTQLLKLFWSLTRELLLKSPLFWAIVLVWLVYWAYTDFWDYMRVGRGGTPSTFAGWWRNKILLLIALVLRADVYGAPYLDPMTEPYRGKLFGLPRRAGKRPVIVGFAPQRQGNQRVNPETEAAMVAILNRKAAENPDLVMQRSFFEGHLCALRKRFPAGVKPAGTPMSFNEWGGEICHVHIPDGGSAHIILHPGDAQEVIQAGYGERHPLACCAERWIWRFYHHTIRGTRLPLPFNFILFYAPRDADEMAIFERILDAAIWFHTLPKNGASSNCTPAPALPAFPALPSNEPISRAPSRRFVYPSDRYS